MPGMTDDAHMLAYSAILLWLMIIVAAYIRAGGSLVMMFSNRDALPPETPLAGRADRAAKNMIENMVLFTAIWVATRGVYGAADNWKVLRGAQIFFAARVVYWPLYLAGVKVVRTTVWFVGFVGIAMMAVAVLQV
jgi:uncharacterized MAPEG superfamily protein